MAIMTPTSVKESDLTSSSAPANETERSGASPLWQLNGSSSKWTGSLFEKQAKEWWQQLGDLDSHNEDGASLRLAVIERLHPGACLCVWSWGKVEAPSLEVDDQDIMYTEKQLLVRWLEFNGYKVEVAGPNDPVMVYPAIRGALDIPPVQPISDYYLARVYDNSSSPNHGEVMYVHETVSLENALRSHAELGDLAQAGGEVVATICRNASQPVEIWSTELSAENNFRTYGSRWTKEETKVFGPLLKAHKIRLTENVGLGNAKANKGLYIYETPSGSNARICRKAPNGQWMVLNLHAPLLRLLKLQEYQTSINWSLKFTRATDDVDPMRLVRENEWSTTRAVELDAGSKTLLSMMMDAIIEDSVNAAKDYLDQQGKKF